LFLTLKFLQKTLRSDWQFYTIKLDTDTESMTILHCKTLHRYWILICRSSLTDVCVQDTIEKQDKKTILPFVAIRYMSLWNRLQLFFLP
jgi:hypothetical protein